MARHTTNEQREMMYLFERPSDPLYMPRAGNTIVFNLPSADVPSGFAPRFGGEPPGVINVETDRNLPGTLPNLVTRIPRGSPFSLNIREHRQAAQVIIDMLQKATTVDQLRNIAASIREEINETLFVYALSFILTRNKLFRGLRVPSILETFPSRFIPSNIIDRARSMVNRENSNRNSDESQALVINHDQDFSGLRSRLENRVAYWREDFGLNAHHWHWHLVFPSDLLLPTETPPDRKGEIFYYMHQQIVARYDMERMSVGLPRVVKLDNLREPVPDGYFSKLRFDNADTNPNRIMVPGLNPNATLWGTRQDNTLLGNYTRLNTFFPVDVAELELWRDRLLDGIHQGFFINAQGTRVPLSDDVDITDGRQKRGIDIIGDAFEADQFLSPNYGYYGDMHNFGHVLIASAHDPDGTHGENLGVMSDSATAMRDPIFYRWHKHIDWIFQQYKARMPVYTVADLQLEGVSITRLGVATGNVADELHTGWTRREFEASRGIDFGTARSVRIDMQHLDHKPFDYHILANNSTGGPKQVYVRIFLAPKINPSGMEMPLLEQRLLWAEMDKFVFTLKPGANHIKRPSSQSSVAITGELTFRELETGIRGGIPASERPPGELEEDFCGCGWPQHLLVPRGRPEGMDFQIFVMMTDYEEDRMPGPSGARQCASASSYCGVLDSRYPDKRPMGFPFDRLPPRELRTPREQVITISDLAILDNMFVHDIKIRFLGELSEE
uniref:Phenoloxidase 2-like n=1 Tax=Hirondellea gigas TaxID=1518452 RepID=A0A6A7FNP2_9CRUS